MAAEPARGAARSRGETDRRVLEEPEADLRGAVRGVAVEAEVGDDVAGDGLLVGRGVAILDVVLVLRLADRRPEPAREVRDVLRVAAGEVLVAVPVDRVGDEQRLARGRGVVEDRVPVVARGGLA